MDKFKDQYQKYMQAIPQVSALFDVGPFDVGDVDEEYEEVLADLPSEVVGGLEDIVVEDSADWSNDVEHSWCFYEMPEGKFPEMHYMSSLRELVEMLVVREGKEMAVGLSYGVPLKITKAIPHPRYPESSLRFMILPNNAAVAISEKESFQVINLQDLPSHLEIQEDGWIGEPGLGNTEYYEAGYSEIEYLEDGPVEVIEAQATEVSGDE